MPTSDALAPPTSPSIITQKGSHHHRSVGVAEERKWFIILALLDAIPGHSALEEGDSHGRARDSSMIAPGAHPMQLPSARTCRGPQSQGARNGEDSYCQVQRFLHHHHISTEPGKGPGAVLAH